MDYHGRPDGVLGFKKIINIFFPFFPRATPGPSSSIIIKQDIHIQMLRIAGQTAEPIGPKFFVDTHGWPGGVIG